MNPLPHSIVQRLAILGAGASGACVLFCAAGIQAQVPFNLASSIGNASTQTAAYGITPSAGTQQFLLTTINPPTPLPGDGSLGTTPATTNVPNLNTYFGLPAGTLAARGIQDGSGYLSQQLTLTVGTVVSFDYIFLTNEDNTVAFNNDQAFFTVNGTVNATLRTAGSLTTAELNAGTGSPNFSFQSRGNLTSGYTRFNYTVPATGNYTFGFGVSDVTNTLDYSGLLIDNLRYAIVPEPGTVGWLTFGGAMACLVAARRRSAPASR